MSQESHTLAHYIWLSGGSQFRHFSRYYVFLTESFWPKRTAFWLRIYAWLDRLLPTEIRLELLLDDTTRKKSGKKIQGCAHYSNRAGSARQEYRVLWGLNFVYICLRVDWRGYQLSIPLGISVYLKEEQAKKWGRIYESRSQLARQMLELLVVGMPERTFRLVADGGYATREMQKALDARIQFVGRMMINAAIYEQPRLRQPGQRGRTPLKGKRLPAPKTWPDHYDDWKEHPTEAGAWVRSLRARWHKVRPGENLLVVVVWRPDLKEKAHPRDQRRVLEAFFSTDLNESEEAVLKTYAGRWAIEIDIRDAYAHYGLGHDRCRNLTRIEALNQMRLMLAATRTIWFMVTYQNQTLDLVYLRPWYITKADPSQRDIATALREALNQEAISPIPRFFIPIAEIQQIWQHFFRATV